MQNVVLDSWSLIALTNLEQPAATRVKMILEESARQQVRLFISFINLGEIYYIIGRRRGKNAAEQTIADLHKLPITFVSVDEAFITQAATYKMTYPISYADAFAVTCAIQRNATLLTGDPEIAKLANLVDIELLQRDRT